MKMNYTAMFKTVDDIGRKTGRSKPAVFADIVKCGIKYGAGYQDYKLCEFYNLTDEQRSTYVTRGINNSIVKKLNRKEDRYIFEDKTVFNSVFSGFIKREWLDMSENGETELAEFIKNKEYIIAKPASSTCGKGVEKIKVSDFTDTGKLFGYLKKTNCGLVEECIKQHHVLNEIYPCAVNTLRIVTLLDNDKNAHIVYAFIRIGNGGRNVDNINSGGMAAPIDIDTGAIAYPAFDKDQNYYETHPMTGHFLVGQVIPYWDSAKKMCLKAAKIETGIRYVGWDTAITPDGPLLVEGNHFPGHDILQLPPHVPDKIGMLPKFREFIDI